MNRIYVDEEAIKYLSNLISKECDKIILKKIIKMNKDIKRNSKKKKSVIILKPGDFE